MKPECLVWDLAICQRTVETPGETLCPACRIASDAERNEEHCARVDTMEDPIDSPTAALNEVIQP